MDQMSLHAMLALPVTRRADTVARDDRLVEHGVEFGRAADRPVVDVDASAGVVEMDRN